MKGSDGMHFLNSLGCKLQFRRLGGECDQVRFTTRSGLCDITAPNTDCAKTPFFSAFQSFLVGFPHRQAMDEGPLTVESAARGVEAGGGILYSGETSEAKSPNSRFDSFWNRLISELPPHITAAGSYADAAEWILPRAPFSAEFAFD